MAAKKEPNLGINYGWALGEDNWKDGMDANLLLLGAILNLQVTAIQNAPPTGTLTNGMRYIVGTAPTGAWAGKANQVAVLVEASWTFWAPKAGWCAQVESTATEWLYTGTAWQNKVAAVADVSAGTAPDTLLASIGGVKALIDNAGVGAYLNDTANLNNATKNGFFAWNNTSTNTPAASSYGRGYTIASDANNATQYGIINATGAMYVRFRTAGAWSAWTKVGASSAGDVGALALPTADSTGSINALITAAIYSIPSTMTGLPVAANGVLIVTAMASGANVIQDFSTISASSSTVNRAFRRSGTVSGGVATWGPWVPLNMYPFEASNVDLNTCTTPGIYQGGSFTNGPSVMGTASCSIVVQSNGAGNILAQTATYTSSNRVFVRSLVGSTWADWMEVGGFSSNKALPAEVTSLTDPAWFSQNITYVLSGTRSELPAGTNVNAMISSWRRQGGTIAGITQLLFTTTGIYERRGAPNASNNWTAVTWYGGGDANGWKLLGTDAMTAIGIGSANQTLVANFDWQQADFYSEQNICTQYSSWQNGPAGVAYITGASVIVKCVLAQNGRYVLRVYSLGDRPEYIITTNGAKGSRTFEVVQTFNSGASTLIPLTNGGLGANTAAGGRKTLGFEDLGFGIAAQLPVDPFDWQQADFVTGQKRLATVGAWLNAPAAVAFGASTVANIECILAQVNRLVLRVTSNAQSSSNRAEYIVTSTGVKGTRSFTVVQSFNSDASTVIPLANGGTGGKTLAEAQAVLGINPAFVNAVADLNTALVNANFAWINTSTNSPVAGSYGRGCTIASDATNVTQIGIINDTGAMYVRYLTGTTWSAWISTTVAALPYLVYSNPGTTPFSAAAYTAIPFYTSGETAGGITLTSNATITVPAAGLYDFELEVRVNGGATNMPPVGTVIGLSIDTTTVPTSLRAGYSAAQAVDSVTILRLHCRERLAAGATRRAYLYNAGAAGYQVTSAVIKVTRVGA